MSLQKLKLCYFDSLRNMSNILALSGSIVDLITKNLNSLLANIHQFLKHLQKPNFVKSFQIKFLTGLEYFCISHQNIALLVAGLPLISINFFFNTGL